MADSKTVSELVRPDRRLLSVGPDATATDVAVFMKTNRIGCVVVTDKHGKLAGILSERDLVCKVLGVGADPGKVRAGDLMTREVMTCTPQTPVQDAERAMAHRRVRHLPVVQEGKPVAVISMRDVLGERLKTYRSIVSSQSAFLEKLESSYPGISQIEKDKTGRIVI
ncbi:MAG: CBS domain-containing protein [Phycisphaerae bacterium]